MKEKIKELTRESEKSAGAATEHLQKALDTLKKSPPSEGKGAEIKAIEEELRRAERNEALIRERHRVIEASSEQREKLQHAMKEAHSVVKKTEEELKK